MFINNKTATNTSIGADKLLEHGITCINTSQWTFAYTVFEHLYQITKDKPVSLFYNMALCHYSAKEYSKAITLLGEALSQIAIPSVSDHSINNLPSELLIQEYKNSHHHLALNETAAVLNNAIVKLRIRRLLVDVHLELQNWQEVVRLSALPEMDKCKNVQEALAIAKTKINT